MVAEAVAHMADGEEVVGVRTVGGTTVVDLTAAITVVMVPTADMCPTDVDPTAVIRLGIMASKGTIKTIPCAMKLSIKTATGLMART